MKGVLSLVGWLVGNFVLATFFAWAFPPKDKPLSGRDTLGIICAWVVIWFAYQVGEIRRKQ